LSKPALDFHRPAPPSADTSPWWRSGQAALLAGVLLWLAGVFGLTGPSSAPVLFVLLTDGLLLLVWLAAGTGLGAFLLGPFRQATSPANPTLVVVTAAAFGLGAFSLAVLGLGLMGWLTAVVAWVLILLALGAVALMRLPHWASRATWGAAMREGLRAPAGWSWLWLVAVPFLSIATVGAMVPPGILWGDEPHGYDVVEYHLQVPREWYEAGRVVPLRHNAFSYFPFNVEAHYLLAMHLRGGPWAGMYLAQLMHVAFVGLSVVAVAGVARQVFPESRAAPALAGVAAATTPWLTLLAPVAYNEGGLLLYGTLAIGWVLIGAKGEGGRRKDEERRTAMPDSFSSFRLHPSALRSFALAGLLAGFACGVKLTGVPLVLLAVAAVSGVMLLLGRVDFARASIAIGLYLACGLLTFSPWLVRNLAWAGNPVFPEGMRLLGPGHFSETQVERWKRAHAPAAEQSPLPARVKAFNHQVVHDWRFGYVLFPLALAAVVFRPRDRVTWFNIAVTSLFTVFWIGFTHLQSRFFVLGVPVAALLIAGAARRRPFAAVAAALLTGSALLGGVHLYQRLARPEYTSVLTAESVDELTPEPLKSVPRDRPLLLVGDAKVFWYQRPMNRLRYRTVFDVDAADGQGAIEAWAGSKGIPAGTWVLVHPDEIRRFTTTYWRIPEMPPEAPDQTQPYLLPPR
jgi:hypothetical protein